MKTKNAALASALLAAVMLMTACGGEKTSGSAAPVNSVPASTPAASSDDTPSTGGNEASASDFEYTVENGGVTITKYLGTETELVLPSQIEGKDVKKLGFSFLRSKEEKAVTSLVMSDTITELNADLFQGNYALKSITFSKGLKTIAKRVCQDASALETIILPDGLEVIEHAAFNNCDALKSIVIPDSVKECSVNSFYACDSLETMTYKGKTYEKRDFDSCYSAINNQQ